MGLRESADKARAEREASRAAEQQAAASAKELDQLRRRWLGEVAIEFAAEANRVRLPPTGRKGLGKYWLIFVGRNIYSEYSGSAMRIMSDGSWEAAQRDRNDHHWSGLGRSYERWKRDKYSMQLSWPFPRWAAGGKQDIEATLRSELEKLISRS